MTLINVTSFFRDPEMFDSLKREILPRILRRGNSQSIRIWIPGCSTGEEPYSLAITMLEYLSEKSLNTSIQIFGTDISASAINTARAGVYPSTIVDEVTPDRLRRFFVKSDSTYQISKAIRDICIFAQHNVVKDPPFSKLDIISCRNLLIYFGPVLQKRVIPVFNYALKSNGYLILGSTETIGGFADFFLPADRKYKIYSKKTVVSKIHFDFANATFDNPTTHEKLNRPAQEGSSDKDVLREGDRLLLSRYAPASVIINDDFDILQFRGRTGLFLEPSQGQASLNLLKMARQGLIVDLRSAILFAKKERNPVKKEGLKLEVNGEIIKFELEVIPFTPGRSSERFYLVLFDLIKGKAPSKLAKPAVPKKPNSRELIEAAQMRQELTATREYLQSIIEEQEASNEELRAANEEILSSNEELQSTNEEMETAKEELQSANEELTTLNEELQNRNLELTLVNNDLSNLLGSVQIPIIMLGPDYRIRRFTPIGEKVLNLIPSDIGRPISDINMNLSVPQLEEWITDVIDNVRITEREVQDRSNHWYKMQIRPYRTIDNKIEGVVLVFIDIHDLKTRIAEGGSSESAAPRA